MFHNSARDKTLVYSIRVSQGNAEKRLNCCGFLLTVLSQLVRKVHVPVNEL